MWFSAAACSRFGPTGVTLKRSVLRFEHSITGGASVSAKNVGVAIMTMTMTVTDRPLRAWTHRFADYVATKRRMGNALRSAAASDSPLLASTRERIMGALRLLLEAGAASGTLRGDVDPKDFMRVINGIWYLPDGPQWREDVGRMLELVIDGLRYGVPDRRQQPAR